jgi:hypothetical protein
MLWLAAALVLITYWYWTLLSVATVVLVWRLVNGYRNVASERRAAAARAAARNTELIDNATREHDQITAGDERGMYGVAWPDVRRYRDAAGT